MTKTIWGVCDGVKRRNILRQHKIIQQVKRAELQMLTRETGCPSQPPFSTYLHKIVNAIGERVLDPYSSTNSEFIKREDYFIFNETTSQREGHSITF